ncbi:TRF-like 6 [Prunus dulcis]|uniref:TRF-like 6 n=1 Tax=Prunus dulcis TaxID=3755 RepID=A0A4Y1RM52_PRUDU|nr:TRF-like 6 [Prunus dulcis]
MLMFQETDNAVCHGRISLPTCQEYLWEAKHSDKVFKSEGGPDSCLQNAGLESHSSGVYKEYCGAEMSDLSCESTPRLGYKDNRSSLLLDHMSVQERQLWFKPRRMWSNDTKNEVKTVLSSSIEFFGKDTGTIKGSLSDEGMSRDLQVKWKKLADLESLKTSNSRVSEIELCSSDERDKAGAFAMQKRSRRPPRRYIEELAESKSKFYSRKCGVACKRSKNSFLHVRSDKNNRQKETQEETLLCQDKSYEVGCIQVPFGLPVEAGHLEEHDSSLNSEDCKDHRLLRSSEKLEIEYSPAKSREEISDDECVLRRSTQKDSKQIKHYTSWTSSEVMKLIEGVSQCGVGRWSAMKRLLFSSCSHRTAVDIKDKWRNLLKASCTQLQKERKIKRDISKQASDHVPESVLQRVRELAVIYPYPRRKRIFSKIQRYRGRTGQLQCLESTFCIQGICCNNNSEDCKDHRLLGSSEKLEIECSPAKSREEISEDESVSRINTRKGSKQTKLYTSWTSSQIKRDISKRASDHVPVSVLQRVMELAVIYPYPRQKKVRS